jgi:P27 family predicted phage terminase small subunit
MPSPVLTLAPRRNTAGRPPKPAEVKRKEGNRGRRPIDPAGLEAVAKAIERVDGLPSAPDHLDEHEGRLWEYFGGLVIEMKVLSKNDLTALTILCENEATRLELGDYLKDHGRFHTIMSTAGDMVDRARPQFTEWQRLNGVVMGQLREFGLTPASRPKIQVVPGAGRGMKGSRGDEDEDERAEKAYW